MTVAAILMPNNPYLMHTNKTQGDKGVYKPGPQYIQNKAKSRII